MIDKLRQNYRASLWAVRILFVVTFVFAQWRESVTALMLFMNNNSIWLALAMCALSGIIALVLYPFVINVLLNLFRIYSVPRAEYVLLALFYASFGQLITGALNCILFITPVVVTWGAILFNFIGTTVAAVMFYAKTSKLYFNDITRVYYFKNLAIVYFVVMILGVIL